MQTASNCKYYFCGFSRFGSPDSKIASIWLTVALYMSVICNETLFCRLLNGEFIAETANVEDFYVSVTRQSFAKFMYENMQ